MDIANIIEELLEASHKESFACAQQITNILHAQLPIKACSFYSYFEATGYLSLRSQTGFDYADYSSFELPIDSLAGKAITQNKIVERKSLTKKNGFRDQNLVSKYDLRSMYAIPLHAKDCLESISGQVCQNYLGVVCIYPDSNIDQQFEPQFLEKLSAIVGKVYAYSVIQDRVSVRKGIVNNSIRAKDLNSFLHKVLLILGNNWGIEASSVFIHDLRNDILFMRATSGVETDAKLIDRCYRREETHFKTVECFNSEEIITITNGSSVDHKYPELVKDGYKSIMYIPIYEPTGTGVNGEKNISGVMRCVNRIVRRDAVEEVCHHGWEDASLMLFVAEVIGVISHLFKRNDEISLNFERAMHGINKPIHAAKTRIKSTQQYMSSQGLLRPPFDNFMKASISYLDALEWQIQKHTVSDSYKKIKTSKINLFGQVLSQILSFMNDCHKTYNVKKFSINQLDYTAIPSVIGDEKALQIVFRNIVENSMKYSPPTKFCTINISWKIDVEYLYIVIDDYGIGVGENDEKRIFDEGYRGMEAMRVEPTGTGIGLSDSREIMREMGGDITLESNRNPTRFVVKIKK
jgi:hypothetical protein